MLTKKNLEQIKDVVQDAIQPLDKRLGSVENKIDKLEGKVDKLEGKVDKLAVDVSDLKLETRAIHEIIKTQSDDHELRIEKLEDSVGINP